MISFAAAHEQWSAILSAKQLAGLATGVLHDKAVLIEKSHCRSVDEIGYPKKSCGHYIVSIRHF